MAGHKPTVDVIDSRNLYVDPTCKGRWNARFMVYTFESSYAEMKEDSRYKNLDAVNWESIETTTNMGPQNPIDQHELQGQAAPSSSCS